MATVFTLLLLAALVFLVWGLIAPKSLPAKNKLPLTRGKASLIFGVTALVLFVLVGVTAPPQEDTILNTSGVAPAHTEENQQNQGPEITVGQVLETATIPFTTATKDDNTLATGQTQVAQEGSDGVKTYTYQVTYTDGVETERVLVSETVTTPPVEKIIHNGTYVAPKPKAASCNSGYVNVDGNCVRSPSDDPAGASAQCRDGTYSYSQNRRGTCSHHGGVARWL